MGCLPQNMNSVLCLILLYRTWVETTKANQLESSKTASPSVKIDGKNANPKVFSGFMVKVQIHRWKKCKYMPRKSNQVHNTCVVSGFMVKIASCKLPNKASITRAPETISTPFKLKFGEVCASAKVKRIKPITNRTADKYSLGGYFRFRPGMKAPITITGRTCNTTNLKIRTVWKSRHTANAENLANSILKCLV